MSELQEQYYYDTKDNKMIHPVDYKGLAASYRDFWELGQLPLTTLKEFLRRFIRVRPNQTCDKYTDSYRFVYAATGNLTTFSFAYTRDDAVKIGKKQIAEEKIIKSDLLGGVSDYYLCERTFPLPEYIQLIKDHLDPNVSISSSQEFFETANVYSPHDKVLTGEWKGEMSSHSISFWFNFI